MNRHKKLTKFGDWWDSFSQWLITIAVFICAAGVASAAGILLLLLIAQKVGQ